MADDRPNILIITTDQQSHHMMSCAGNAHLQTPAMDRLAERGTRFTKAYAANPVCSPARFAWYTGRMPSTIGMRKNGDDPDTAPDGVAEGGLGSLLRDAGYDCFFGGKSHFPANLSPEDLGFTTYTRNDRERLAEETAQLIESDRERPWCIAANFMNPHDICYLAIRAFADNSGDQRIRDNARVEFEEVDAALRPSAGVDVDDVDAYCPPLPDNFEVPEDEPEAIRWLVSRRGFRKKARELWSEDDWRKHRRAYHRLTERVDAHIAVVLESLDRSGAWDNTVVIFTSDHGDHSASHRMEHKTTFYDESVHVPFIIVDPAAETRGGTNAAWVSNSGLDLMATCCDYAGIAPPAHNIGGSLRAAAQHDNAAAPDGAFAESQIGTMWVSREHKYCRYDIEGVEEILYDLGADPGEMRNCAGDPDKAEILATHRAALDRATAEHAALQVST